MFNVRQLLYILFLKRKQAKTMKIGLENVYFLGPHRKPHVGYFLTAFFRATVSVLEPK